MKYISPNISYNEVVKSLTAIRKGFDNTPDEEQLTNIRLLAKYVLEPIREKLGDRPLYYASFFRSGQLNDYIGGALGSQHIALNGAAADIDQDNHKDCATNLEVFKAIKSGCVFDQLIYEYGDESGPDWVHVSYNSQHCRNEVLRAVRLKNGATKYVHI